jgi:ubiquinone/menaquinone biosynthesis C-methylase UbiE
MSSSAIGCEGFHDMTPPIELTADARCDQPAGPMSGPLPIPRYLETDYWWAYIHPRAVQVFEREWLVNLILFGNYQRLCAAALTEFDLPLQGRTLQIACVYGDLSLRLRAALSATAHLEVVDILPIQLQNLRAKLPSDKRVTITQGDSSALAAADASFEQVLLFFLLHEQPEQVRRATLAEAMRVVKPGGKLVIVDYHRPVALHPLRWLLRAIFRRLEPYAMDLWRQEIATFLPADRPPAALRKCIYFGGLYQKLVVTR